MPIFTGPDGIQVGQPLNRTRRPGYDSQPQFTRDGMTLLVTARDAGNTDIVGIPVRGGEARKITDTAPESEYSAIPIPGRNTLAAVRVEADSAQRLWEFDMDGNAVGVLLEDVAPVGYHAWADESTVVMFVLGDPPTLQIADLSTGTVRQLDSGIGRSIQKIPGGGEISYHRIRDEGSWIMALDPTSGAVRKLLAPVEGSQDHVWVPGGYLLMGSGSSLFSVQPNGTGSWTEVADLGQWGQDISRLAVSPDGRNLAVVMIPVG